MSRFAENLKHLRKSSGMSQQQLADATQLTRSAVGMYETSQREPNIETLIVLADVFNVSIDTLVGRSSATLIPAAERSPVTKVKVRRSTGSKKAAPGRSC